MQSRGRTAEYTILKCVALTYWLFGALGTWKTANTGRGFLRIPLSASREILQERPIVLNHFPELQQPGQFDPSQERLELDTQMRFITNHPASRQHVLLSPIHFS